MKGPDKKKKSVVLLISQCQCSILQLVPILCYEGGCSCLPRERRCGGPGSDLLRSTLYQIARWHGSVAWQPSAACPFRMWGTSIILQLMKSDIFYRLINFSASADVCEMGEYRSGVRVFFLHFFLF